MLSPPEDKVRRVQRGKREEGRKKREQGGG